MATATGWTPFGVSLNITATGGTVTRTSATQFTVSINASWIVSWTGNSTNYGMKASAGGGSVTLNPSGTYSSGNSSSFTGTFSVSGNGAATQTITVTFTNFITDWQGNVTSSASNSVSFSVSVPAWTSYTVSYNANGGWGVPGSQTKWKNQTLYLSSTIPSRTGYTFKGWATSSGGGVAYAAGAAYTGNASITLYAVWQAYTYTVSYNANGGSGAPSSQTKTYGVTLTLSSTKPTRTNYNFKGWGTSAGATTVSYAPGSSYTNNSGITLYAIWELAYTKPRITNFSAVRCNSSGTASNDGTYVLVSFKWATDKTISSVKINWKLSTATSYSDSATVSASGTSGTVGQVVGSGGFSTLSAYDIQVVVADSIDSTSATLTVSSLNYTIHARSGGNGIAFGKAAETDGYLDVAYKARFRDSVDIEGNTEVDGILQLGKYVDKETTFEGGIKIHDLRNVDITPSTFGDRVMNIYSDYNDSKYRYEARLSVKGWDKDHYTTHELAFDSTDDDNHNELYHRVGRNGAWEEWKVLLDSSNYTNYAVPKSTYGKNKVLWAGGWYMNASQTATLLEAISAQVNGIVLMFSLYNVNTGAVGQTFNYAFVPKYFVSALSGQSSNFPMVSSQYGNIGHRMLYINDTQIVGHVANTTSGTINGVTFNNANFVLRYVIGV